MDPMMTYDYLVLSRKRVLDAARELSAEQYERELPIGMGSLRRTLNHILLAEWYYVQRMKRVYVPDYGPEWPYTDDAPLPFAELEAAWSKQADDTRATIAGVGDWEQEFEYEVQTDGVRNIATASAGGMMTQLALHEVHHRSQAMGMLRQLGRPVEEIDFNALMFSRRPV